MEYGKQEKLNLWGFEVDVGFFPKKEALKEARRIEINAIHKADYGFTAEIYAGFCGNRNLYLSNTQYTYLKREFSSAATDTPIYIWVKSEEKGINKKTKKMEHKALIATDKDSTIWI
jgi:hypothetical protein